jgi:hypothetical protein
MKVSKKSASQSAKGTVGKLSNDGISLDDGVKKLGGMSNADFMKSGMSSGVKKK